MIKESDCQRFKAQRGQDMLTPPMANVYKVVVDESLRTRLHDLDGIVKLCDESGQVVAHVLPVQVPLILLEGLRKCPHTEEELERSRQETGGKTLDEILKGLGQTA
jgi:hypothetical protein